MAFTFRGGISLGVPKKTAKYKIEAFTPTRVLLPCSSDISVGQEVVRGQLLCEDAGGVLWHASISGKISEIKEIDGASYALIESENAEETEASERAEERLPAADKPLSAYSPEEILERIRLAGIFGMGGGASTYKKLADAMGKVERLIVNCAESEPYASADHRTLLETPEDVVNGAKILMRALSLRIAYIAVEEDKYDAAEAVDRVNGQGQLVRVRMLKTKYPQGSERLLVAAVTGKKLKRGQSPVDAGCFVINCRTCAAVFRAFAYGEVVTSTVVTVSGAVKEPKNLRVPLGTLVCDILEHCGADADAVIVGGAMMGKKLADTTVPLIYESSILCLEKKDRIKDGDACVRCGRCVSACPMALMPSLLYGACRKGKTKKAEKLKIDCCIECGSCAYVCPARLPIAEEIRKTKAMLKADASAEIAEELAKETAENAMEQPDIGAETEKEGAENEEA